MRGFDPAAFGRQVAQTVKEFVAPIRAGHAALEAANAALMQRVDALERQVTAQTVKSARIDRSGVLFLTLGDGTTQDVGPVVGRDADPAQVKALVDDTVARGLAALPPPAAAPTAADLRPVMTEIAEAILEPRLKALTPAPAPAPTAADLRPVMTEIAEAILEPRLKALTPAAAAPPPEAFRGVLSELVDAAIGALPAPEPGKPGRDADPAEVKRLVEETVARGLAEITPAKDGRGIAKLLISDAGELIVTLTDGDVVNAGRVKGRDGAEPEALRLVDAGDGRTFVLELTTAAGSVVKSPPISWPGLVDRGIWQARTYAAGDGVTYKGSYWIAGQDTDGRPGDPETGWRLAVKRGRDGRPERQRGAVLEGAA